MNGECRIHGSNAERFRKMRKGRYEIVVTIFYLDRLDTADRQTGPVDVSTRSSSCGAGTWAVFAGGSQGAEFGGMGHTREAHLDDR